VTPAPEDAQAGSAGAGVPAPSGQAAALSAGEAVSIVASLVLDAPDVFGGLRLVGPPGEARDSVLDLFGQTRRIPLSADFERLVGGLDLTATLADGAPRAARGLLADGDLPLVLPCAERASGEISGLLGVFLDGEALDAVSGARFRPRPVVALDEAGPDDPSMDPRLADRLAFVLPASSGANEIAPLRRLPRHWRDTSVSDETAAAISEAALALGVLSLRADIHAFAAVKAIAALRGRSEARDEDVAAAVALVLLPRALGIPAPQAADESDAPPDPPEPAENENPADSGPDSEEAHSDDEGNRDDAGERLVEAATARLDPGLLAALAGSAVPRARTPGRSGRKVRGGRGRPVGVRAGVPGRDGRIALVETLTAAAPWRAVRKAEPGRIPVRRSDLRVRRTRSRAATATIFAVDASGSQAFARMAEAKGAVECLLADAYIRRDEVALVAFRKEGAEVLLPPTASLARAKRALAALPGGGGTPLAAGLVESLRLARLAMRAGREPTIVVLTDARANVPLAGGSGRAEARDDAYSIARAIRAEGVPAVLVDTAARPGDAARLLAAEMAARYAPLPRSGPRALAAIAAPARR